MLTREMKVNLITEISQNNQHINIYCKIATIYTFALHVLGIALRAKSLIILNHLFEFIYCNLVKSFL